MTKYIEVVGAVIVRDSLVFCAQRGPGGAQAGRWEFPGGKVEPGEAPEAALVREIFEELGCAVVVGDRIVTTEHVNAAVGGGAAEPSRPAVTIVLTTYYCALAAGGLGSGGPAAGPRLSEHVDSRWLAADQLEHLDWAPADVPAVRRIAADLGA